MANKLGDSYHDSGPELFQFLRLPYELRLVFYRHCLVSQRQPIYYLPSMQPVFSSSSAGKLCAEKATRCRVNKTDGMRSVDDLSSSVRDLVLHWSPQLALVSRQLHAETNRILYGFNSFGFKTWEDLHSFRAQVGSQNVNYIQRLELPFPTLQRFNPRFPVHVILRIGGPGNGWGDEMSTWAEAEITNLENLQSLKMLDLVICWDLTSKYLRNIPEFPRKQDSYKVRVNIQPVPERPYQAGKHRTSTVGKHVLDEFKARRWEPVGDFTVVA